MDELTSKLSDILGSPDNMAKIMEIASQLGLGGGASGGNSSGANASGSHSEGASDSMAKIMEMASQFGLGGGGASGGNSERASDNEPGIDMNMLMNIQRVMSSMNKNDKNTELLRALKPHFSDERRHKVDEAVKILQLISMLPALTESGLFGMDKIFGGGDRR